MYKVHIIQFQPNIKDLPANIESLERLFNQIRSSDLIVLPELSNSGYNFSSRKQALEASEEIGKSEFLDFLHLKAKELDTHIVAGFNERVGEKLFNTSVLLNAERLVGKYRKIHLFMNEKDLFEPGDLEVEVFDVNGLKIGMLICFDYLFPELWRTLALKGADLVCHPSNLVTPFGRRVAPVQGIINRYYVATANRTGTENGLSFNGGSFISDPVGEMISKASDTKEEIIFATIDPKLAKNKMITERNHVLNDRRPAFYSSLIN